MPTIDKNLAKIRDSHESLFTILTYETSREDFISDLKKRLDKIKDIKNTFKKKKLNDRIFKLVTFVEQSPTQIYNKIILLSDDIVLIDLTNQDIKMLKEYSIPNYTFEYGEYFNVNWITDLFENFTFYNIVIFNSNQYTHWYGNLNKKKKINQTSSQDYIKSLDKQFYLFGKINNFSKDRLGNKNLIEYIATTCNYNECIENILKLEIKSNTKLLDEIIQAIKVDSSKHIFGEEIYESIENYNIKELYIHVSILKQFEDKIKEKNLTDNINFNIIHIDTFDPKNPDSSIILIKDYAGMIGIKYF